MKLINVEKVKLAQLPTPLEQTKQENMWIKRDDLTGVELSGNKVRKLEYAFAEAINKGHNTLITCGGIQSNHCRATAVAAVKKGMKCHLVLRGNPEKYPQGNLLLDYLVGATITWVDADTYANARQEVMESLADQYKSQGDSAYIIPEGASNGIGSMGYVEAAIELNEQFKGLKIAPKRVYVTVGSGGTYAGLVIGSLLVESPWSVIGIPIAADYAYFLPKILGIIEEAKQYLSVEALEILKRVNIEDYIHLEEGYQGLGYGICEPHEAEFIKQFSLKEGIFLDPVYTGKAMRGTYALESHIKDQTDSVFIHTGGLYGLFAQNELFKE